ncbi:MAG: glutaredoxin domain-containing protein [Ilumatobacteraceae bacterium]
MTSSDERPTPDITVFWRPGCPFCGSLFRQLEREGVEHRRVNIWEDPDGAATVRSIARGNETVPTVLIGSVGLVNPSVREIQAAVIGA